MTNQEPHADYIGIDLGGYEYNKKYPPNIVKYGSHNGGYPTDNQEAFFYDLAVNLYGLRFTYKGKTYRIPSDGDGWIVINESDNTQSESFETPIDLIENIKIEDKPIIDLIDDFSDLEQI